jgi:hypothetical protein
LTVIALNMFYSPYTGPPTQAPTPYHGPATQKPTPKPYTGTPTQAPNPTTSRYQIPPLPNHGVIQGNRPTPNPNNPFTL